MNHFHFVHYMDGFNSVHYLKYFRYGWDLFHCKTVENGWMRRDTTSSVIQVQGLLLEGVLLHVVHLVDPPLLLSRLELANCAPLCCKYL